MGYHVTILRTADGRELPISLEEAKAAADALGSWVYSEPPPRFVLHGTEGSCTLWHQHGELWANTPDAWEIAPMLELARQLGARVRGDEDETYESVDRTYLHPDDRILQKKDEVKIETQIAANMREQKIIRAVIVGLFGVLAVIAYFVGSCFEKN
jgi:hypothetical protein